MPKTDTQITLWVEPKDPELSVLYLNLDEIRRDGGTQPRAAIDLKHVKLLESQIEDGFELEPVIVFYDGESYWLADGFHRWHAHRNFCIDAIAAIVHQGSRRDAVLFSVGANAFHKPALPRSREDKRRSVMTLLYDEEWQGWSNTQIAKACRVDEKTVRNIRKTLTSEIRSEATRTYKTKHGTIAAMDTANIGKKVANSVSGLQKCDAEGGSLCDHRVTLTIKHPLDCGSSGTIWELSNPECDIVELDGETELININHFQPALAQQKHLQEGALVEITASKNSSIDGRLSRIAAVGESTIAVWVRDISTMVMHRHTLKHQQVKLMPIEEEPQLKRVRDRIDKLMLCNLEPFEVEILNLLERCVAYTPTELEYLAIIEKRYENLLPSS